MKREKIYSMVWLVMASMFLAIPATTLAERSPKRGRVAEWFYLCRGDYGFDAGCVLVLQLGWSSIRDRYACGWSWYGYGVLSYGMGQYIQ